MCSGNLGFSEEPLELDESPRVLINPCDHLLQLCQAPLLRRAAVDADGEPLNLARFDYVLYLSFEYAWLAMKCFAAICAMAAVTFILETSTA